MDLQPAWESRRNRSVLPLKKRKVVDLEGMWEGVRKETEECTVSEITELPQWPKRRSRNFGRIQVDLPILDKATGKLEDSYWIQQELGSGHFGVVRACMHKTSGEMLACKSIDKKRLVSKADRGEVCREIAIMEELSGHKNVVGLREVFEDSEAVHIVMELCEGGELFDEILKRGHYSEAEAAAVFKEIVSVVSFCHSKGVLHRDLKPENILLASECVPGQPHPMIKLADYGLALLLREGDKSVGLAGSPFYMAPEVVSSQEYGMEADVWSLGVILYILLSGVPPFWGPSDEKVFEAIKKGEFDFVEAPWGSVSAEAKSLIRSLLSARPSRRPAADRILSHPWLTYFCPEVELSSLASPGVTGASIGQTGAAPALPRGFQPMAQQLPQSSGALRKIAVLVPSPDPSEQIDDSKDEEILDVCGVSADSEVVELSQVGKVSETASGRITGEVSFGGTEQGSVAQISTHSPTPYRHPNYESQSQAKKARVDETLGQAKSTAQSLRQRRQRPRTARLKLANTPIFNSTPAYCVRMQVEMRGATALLPTPGISGGGSVVGSWSPAQSLWGPLDRDMRRESLEAGSRRKKLESVDHMVASSIPEQMEYLC